MLDECLTAAFRRLGLNVAALAALLGPDWRVEGEYITDDYPGFRYRIQGDEILVIRSPLPRGVLA